MEALLNAMIAAIVPKLTELVVTEVVKVTKQQFHSTTFAVAVDLHAEMKPDLAENSDESGKDTAPIGSQTTVSVKDLERMKARMDAIKAC